MPYFVIDRKEASTLLSFRFNEISLTQREELRKELDEVVAQGDRNFVFDLSKIGFMSSLLIATLVYFQKEINAMGGELKLCGLSKETENVLEITKVAKMFQIYKTPEDAQETYK